MINLSHSLGDSNLSILIKIRETELRSDLKQIVSLVHPELWSITNGVIDALADD